MASNIPVFKLYGEGVGWPTPDLLHCESIPERSGPANWEIRQHRHADLGQLLYVQRGLVILDVEGKVTRIDKPAIQIVPPMHVHGFRFSKNVEGYVLTVALPLIQWLRENLRDLQTPFQHPGCYAVASDKAYIDLLYEKITQEYAAPAPGRDLLLRSLLSALLIWVERQHREMYQAAGNLDRAEFHLAAFSTLIERHYADHWPVSRFADRLGISAVQLNNVCRRLVGQSALEILHQRVLLEAQRNLTYTTMGVAQISDRLGFAEPAYFSRFFRRLAGTTPRQFRDQSRGSHLPSA
ncbi:helix-turn-helix domain-containing protein [Paraburkholderia jirisanensis]